MAVKSVVNVAQVRHYSPFRYPGGKTWFVPHFRQWITGLSSRPATLVEAFAGGAIVGLTAVAEGLVDKLVLVEQDESVAAVWKTVLGAKCDWLIRKILDFDMNRDHVVAELRREPTSTHAKAFQTILRNRVQRGGILAPGASLMLNGENGKGVASRWYPQTLASRLELLKGLRDRITILQADALKVIPRYARDRSCAFFIDPPYTAGGKRAGSRLYANHELNHDLLFRCLAGVERCGHLHLRRRSGSSQLCNKVGLRHEQHRNEKHPSRGDE